jgi:DNA replication protein DnaC
MNAISTVTGRMDLSEKLKARGLPRMTEAQFAAAVAAKMQQTSAGRCVANCPECGGDGFVKVAPGASVFDKDYGTVRPCSLRMRRERESALRRGEFDARCGLTADEIKNLTWSNVLPDISDGVKALRAVKAGYENKSGMVLLYGTYGQAKTLTMKIAVAQAMREGKRAAYARLSRVLNDIRLAFDQKEGKTRALLEKIEWWNGLDLLCVDELDKASSTDWAEGVIFDMFDDRWVKAVRGEALTIAAANFADADAVPGYLKSRLEDNRFAAFGGAVYLSGSDGRKSMPEGYRY